jgi:hypothetical protein
MKKIEYWTVWSAYDQVCTRHKTFAAAERAARECERRGGAEHRIYRVEQCARTVRPA